MKTANNPLQFGPAKRLILSHPTQWGGGSGTAWAGKARPAVLSPAQHAEDTRPAFLCPSSLLAPFCWPAQVFLRLCGELHEGPNLGLQQPGLRDRKL